MLVAVELAVPEEAVAVTEDLVVLEVVAEDFVMPEEVPEEVLKEVPDRMEVEADGGITFRQQLSLELLEKPFASTAIQVFGQQLVSSWWLSNPVVQCTCLLMVDG